MNHNIFRDLAPSYIDNLTSEETNKLIEKHLKECKDCREYLDDMKEDISLESRDEQTREKRNVDYFKKVRSKNRKKVFTIVGSLLSVFAIILMSFYIFTIHKWIANEDDIEMAISKQDNTVTIAFDSKNKYRYALPWLSREEPTLEREPYNAFIIIYETWDDFTETSQILKTANEFKYTFLDEDTILLDNGEERELTDEDTIQIMYRDNIMEEILLKDLYNMKNDK